jgi:hypothetical protein
MENNQTQSKPADAELPSPKGLSSSALLAARDAARQKVLIDLQEGKTPEEGDTVSAMLKWLSLEAAGRGFDEGVRFMESSANA